MPEEELNQEAVTGTETSDEATEAAASKQVVISVANPTPEEMVSICENIKVNYNFNVNIRPAMFNFKKSKDKLTGIETVRESVQLAIPYPSIEGIIAILEAGGKGLELLQEAVENITNTAARELLYEDLTLTAATFPVDKVSWEAIANQPKAQRRGGGIPKEVWEGFAQDYVEVMPPVTGKSVEQIANAAKLLTGKLSAVRTNEPVLRLLVDQLAVYADNSANIADFSECVEFLLGKADTFLNVSDEELIANL